MAGNRSRSQLAVFLLTPYSLLLSQLSVSLAREHLVTRNSLNPILRSTRVERNNGQLALLMASSALRRSVDVSAASA